MPNDRNLPSIHPDLAELDALCNDTLFTQERLVEDIERLIFMGDMVHHQSIVAMNGTSELGISIETRRTPEMLSEEGRYLHIDIDVVDQDHFPLGGILFRDGEPFTHNDFDAFSEIGRVKDGVVHGFDDIIDGAQHIIVAYREFLETGAMKPELASETIEAFEDLFEKAHHSLTLSDPAEYTEHFIEPLSVNGYTIDASWITLSDATNIETDTDTQVMHEHPQAVVNVVDLQRERVFQFRRMFTGETRIVMLEGEDVAPLFMLEDQEEIEAIKTGLTDYINTKMRQEADKSTIDLAALRAFRLVISNITTAYGDGSK